MSVDYDNRVLRSYVLGALRDEERERLERAYFDSPETLELITAAEDDLIDDYLSDKLAGEERTRFEAYYLSAPRHRTRVAVARALRSMPAVTNDRIEPAGHWWEAVVSGWRAWPRVAALAVIAVLALVVTVAVFVVRSRSSPDVIVVTKSPSPAPPVTTAVPPTSPEQREPAPPTATNAPARGRTVPSIVAIAVSPINVRGAGEPASVSITPDTNVVRLLLQGETGEPRLERGRAIVRTVGGREVWRGPISSRASPPSAIARIDVPARQLRPDDYVVELLAPDTTGREAERYRYFFRVREGQAKNRP
jgi:hypothetical protein